MKLPRGVSADRLIRAVEILGNKRARQKGSHLRLIHPGPPAYSISIPLHNPLKTGTFQSILGDVAKAQSIPMKGIVNLL